MFTIPVSDLLESYSGDSSSFSFSGEVYDGYFDDLSFQKPLEFSLEIMHVDAGIHVTFRDIRTQILYEGKKYAIMIPVVEREFRTHIDPIDDPDDIRPIE
jgi:hypothetical protein